MKTTCRLLGIFLLVGGLLFSYQAAQADVAPPEAPPGSNIFPGGETTQVSMLAEQVRLTVYADPSNSKVALAKTTAVFTMRNLGTEAETLQVRFPLRFMMWEDTTYPEIANLKVKVDGKSVPNHREVLKYTQVWDKWTQEADIPWSVFEVNFPPGQDVSIEVSYTAHGFGYDPYRAFRYVLETGAGWNGSIGSADITVQLPYEASEYNVILDYGTGYSDTTPGAQFSGDEVRWHFENFEPTQQDNIEISLVMPSLWNAIQREKANVQDNPRDGEAWGRLGKDYKQLTRVYKGYPREDEVGYQFYLLSREAYEKCLALLPRDSLWHAGYADLLWNEFYFNKNDTRITSDATLLPRALEHLQTALQLDPNNELARQILDEIYYSYPEAVTKNGDEYIFLGLTAMPPTQTPFMIETPTSPVTEAPAIPPSSTAAAQPVSVTAQPTAIPAPKEKPLPICGGAALVGVIGAIGLRGKRRGSSEK